MAKKEVKIKADVKIHPKRYGMVGLIFGILTIVLGFMTGGPLGFLLGALGIAFSTKQRGIKPNALATAGMITSILGLSLSFFILLVILLYGGGPITALAHLLY